MILRKLLIELIHNNKLVRDYLIIIKVNEVNTHIFFKKEISNVLLYLPLSLTLSKIVYFNDIESKRVIINILQDK